MPNSQLATAAPTMPRTMFMTRPIWLFMNCSASQPAIPPMMMAAIQPSCASFMAISLNRCLTIQRTGCPLNWTMGQFRFWTAKAKFRERPCLLYPRKRTCALQQGMSALGQKRTSRLLDHLIGCGEQRLRNGQTKRLCGLEIDNQLILGRCLHRHVGWLLALEDAIDIPRGTPDGIVRIRPVRNQAPV